MAVKDQVKPIPAIYQRVSTRKFLEKPISRAWIEEILIAGTLAPSSGNMQPWEFIVIEDQELKEDLVKFTFSGYYSKGSHHQGWIGKASVVIVACTNYKRTVARYGEAGKDWAPLDTAAAVENMLLTATAMGLAGCWVGGFHEAGVKELLKIPPYVRPVGLLPLGFPAEEPVPKQRIPLKWVTHKNRYNIPYLPAD